VLLLCGAGQLEGRLAAEKQAHSAVSQDLVAAQREMEGLLRRNHELERANAAMGEQAHQAQVEQQELRANLEAQSAELTSVKVSTPALSCSKMCIFSPLSHPLFMLLHSAPGSFHLMYGPPVCAIPPPFPLPLPPPPFPTPSLQTYSLLCKVCLCEEVRQRHHQY